MKQLKSDLSHAWPAMAMAAAVYALTLTFSFTGWDDTAATVENPLLKSLNSANFAALFRPGAIPDEQLYIPVTYLSFMAEAATFGLRPWLLHLTNVVLHCINVLLVFHVIRAITENRRAAFWTAMIFAVHPLQCESVAWIMGRKDLLATMFSLISTAFWISETEKENFRNFLASLAFFVLAVLSKPTAIVLPGILFLVALFLKRPLDRRLFAKFAVLCAVSILGFATNSMTAYGQPGSSLKFILYRSLFIPAVLEGWLERIFLLSRPSAFYPWLGLVNSTIMTYGTAFISILLLASIYQSFRKGAALAALCLSAFLVSMLPAFSLVSTSYRDFYTADRYGYFALIWPATAVAAILCCSSGFKAIFSKAVLAMLLALMLASSFQQIRIWRNPETLWRSAVTADPRWSPQAYYNLGNYYFRRGDLHKAEQNYLNSLKIMPDADSYYNLGLIKELQKNKDEALAMFLRCAVVDPTYIRARKKAAAILVELERPQDAMKQYAAIAKADPMDPEPYLAAGKLFLKKGDKEKAARAFAEYERLSGRKIPERPPASAGETND